MGKIIRLAKIIYKDGSSRLITTDKINALIFRCWKNKMEASVIVESKRVAGVYQKNNKWHSFNTARAVGE